MGWVLRTKYLWIMLVGVLVGLASVAGQPQKSPFFGKSPGPPPVAKDCLGIEPAAVAEAPATNYSEPAFPKAVPKPKKLAEVNEEMVPVPQSAPVSVLWNQPADSGWFYVSQVMPDNPGYNTYVADDFTNADPWMVSSIYVPGFAQGGSLAPALSLTWSIYPATAPTPPGYPGAGAAPYWTITLPLADPQVSVTPGSYPSDVTLNLVTPIYLPPGTWWFEFLPTMPWAGGLWYWGSSTTTNGFQAEVINPGGGFGQGTDWQGVTGFYGLPYSDMAFRLDGCLAKTTPVNDGGFENVPSAWTEWDTTGCTPWIGNWDYIFGYPPRTGNSEFWAGGYCGSPNSNYAEQTITLPSGSPLILSLWTVFHRMDVDDPASPDTFYVSVNGAPVFTKPMVQANNTSPNWVHQSIDLSAYSGQTVTLRIGADSQGTVTGNVLVDDLTLGFCCPTITLSPLPAATKGQPYSATITASPAGAYTYAVTSGTLPPGLTLDPVTGVLSGTPTTSNAYSFTVTATDAFGCTGSQAYVFDVFLLLLDDMGRSKLCLNTTTGTFQWQILSGPGAPFMLMSAAQVLNAGTLFKWNGGPYTFYLTLDPYAKRAKGYLYRSVPYLYSSLSDMNWTNNVGSCNLSPST
jgi:hypothetical protein